MRQEKKVKDRPAIALVLFFCLAALVAVFAVTSTVNKVRDNLQIDKAAEVVKKKAVSKTSENTAAKVVDSQDSKSSGSNSSASFIKPLSGEVIQKYSMDMPIYWETLDQYMTHDGIDLAAPAGTSVKTCASGTVTRIEKDDRYGMIVEISHGNDLLSLYGNLSEDGLVELGEVVSRGDVIGKVGKTSTFEASGAEHLHFSMKLKDEPVDPENISRGCKKKTENLYQNRFSVFLFVILPAGSLFFHYFHFLLLPGKSRHYGTSAFT